MDVNIRLRIVKLLSGLRKSTPGGHFRRARALTIMRLPGAGRTLSGARVSRYSRKRTERTMLKTIALIGLAATLALPTVAARAQTGFGVSNSAPSTSTFDRAWNHANESKERARASARYVRHHSMAGHSHYHHVE